MAVADTCYTLAMLASRAQAGRQLAEKLKPLLTSIKSQNLVVLSIPRGGVVVGHEIALSFHCNHDILVTKKLSSPHQEELAIGAIGRSLTSLYLNQGLIKQLQINQAYLDQEIEACQQEVNRRELVYRQNRLAADLKNKVVILTDDGAATGATMMAAYKQVLLAGPKRLLIAIPVCAQDTLIELKQQAGEVVVLKIPPDFYAVGQFYQDFPQLTDMEVIKLLSDKAIEQ